MNITLKPLEVSPVKDKAYMVDPEHRTTARATEHNCGQNDRKKNTGTYEIRVCLFFCLKKKK